MKRITVWASLALALVAWSCLGDSGNDGGEAVVQSAVLMHELDGNGDPPRVFGKLSVMSHPWMEGSPSFVKLQRHGDELPTFCFVRGHLAGAKECPD